MHTTMHTTSRDSLFSSRNFRLLFAGSSISLLGDQFTLVALPWLVLTLTGDPSALGLVLAATALPRALFMLIGGAIVDRMSPRRVLLGARAANAALIAALAALVLTGAAHMAAVYLIALGVGVATAFAYPASSAILPQLVSAPQLPAANALLVSTRQLSMFVGPALAGFLIAAGADRGPAGARGLGLAFAVDALSFVLSLAALALLRVGAAGRPPRPPAERAGLLADVAAGVRAVWADMPLRAFMLYAAAVTVLVGGPVQVGLPVLADQRLDLGAAALGLLMTAHGGGMVLGALLSRRAAQLVRGRLGLMVLCIDGASGIAVAALAGVRTTLAGAALLAAAGVMAGAGQVAVLSWIQQRVPQALMGRTMALLMFVFMGLGPISAAAAGALLRWISLPALFVGAGVTLTSIAMGCLTSPALRAIGTARASSDQGAT